MKFFYKNFPFVLLLLTGCYSLFGPKTNITVGFVLEISPGSSSEKLKEILHERLLNSGFYQENIKIESSRNMLELTLDNYDSTETPFKELRKLLTAAGELEFWETYENSEIIPFLAKADSALASFFAKENPMLGSSANHIDTSSVMQMLLTSPESSAISIEKYMSEHPLFFILAPSVDQQGRVTPGPVIGRSNIKDTARVMSHFRNEKIKDILPENVKFAWTNKPLQGTDSVMQLVALKVTRRDGKAALCGNMITDARKEYSQQTANPHISMTMNDEAAQVWTQLTEDNIGKSIAIVFDGQVFSYPIVQGKIEAGVSQITGDFTSTEAETIVSVLKAGMLTGSVKIKGETILLKEK